MLIKAEVVSSTSTVFGAEQMTPKLIGCFEKTNLLLVLGKACLEFLCAQAIWLFQSFVIGEKSKSSDKRYFKFVIEHFICISMAQAVSMGLWLKYCLALELGYMS